MITEGHIGRDERVVAVLTGHLLKDAAAIIGSEPSALEIDANLADLERALNGAR
jgi:threonine synthase